MNPWFGRLKQTTYNTTFMYNVRMLIAFTGTAFVPYLLNFQLATIPLTLGVVAAGISDIDDRFSVRIMNLIYTYIGFFATAVSIYLLFPYPMLFAIGLIVFFDFKKKQAAAPVTKAVSATCAPPPISAALRKCLSSLRENSIPSVNISSTTPVSAKASIRSLNPSPPSHSISPEFAAATPHKK